MSNSDLLLSVARDLFTAKSVDSSWWHKRITFKDCVLNQNAGSFPTGTEISKIVILREEGVSKAKLYINKGDVRCKELKMKCIWEEI